MASPKRAERVLSKAAGCGAVIPDGSLSNEKPKGEPMLTGRELAKLLGVHERTIRDLVDREVIVKAERGKYELAASVRAYCEHLRHVASGRGGESGVSTLTAARARLAREQADAAALKNAALRGEMIAAAEVAAAWRMIMTGVRSRMLAIPSRVRAAIPHMTLSEVDIVEREVVDALKDSANG
ncbi:hypothetical protein LG047_07155 [Methylocystis sp. WRRC1]|uniref:terminase small subunit n=1 Tax=Methylocystis sp. WRRC1 TaxID=1732014 RepID=UPI001D14B392|nr:terminase small subunit [Methylocystis sp. WRRC1]MCC3245095.1 hypothetical protein [Methylocystis sp. WRRC1]